MEDTTVGYWDVCLNLNLSEESIIEACGSQEPTCSAVFELGPCSRETKEDIHFDNCRLCEMIEVYAAQKFGLDPTD